MKNSIGPSVGPTITPNGSLPKKQQGDRQPNNSTAAPSPRRGDVLSVNSQAKYSGDKLPTEAERQSPDNNLNQNTGVSGTAEQQDQWLKSLEACLKQLGSKYPGVSITIGNYNEEQLIRLAQSYGRGSHLVASTDFLRRMASSPQSYEQGKSVLEDFLAALSSGEKEGQGVYLDGETAMFWTTAVEEDLSLNPWERQARDDKRLMSLMEEAKKKAEKTKNKFNVKVSRQALSAASAMGQLAKARTVRDVKSVMASARRNIASLKIALSLGPEKDRNKYRAAIAAMEKVAGRGGKKVKDLTAEGNMEVRREKAEREQQSRKARQIAQELRQKRTARHSREHAQIHEVRDQEWMDKQQQRLEEELSNQLENIEMDLTYSSDASVGEALPAVQLSPPVEISIAAVV